MIGVSEIVIILLAGLFGLAPLVIGVWLIIRVVQLGPRQQSLERRIQALARAVHQNR